MKGFLILWISIASLTDICCHAADRDKEIADTLERSVIYASKSPAAFTGLKRLDHEDLLGGAAILGSPDAIKILQNLPGVASGMELMSGLYVHGGDGSDNLFMLDGVPLFQVSHLGGLFSSFNTDIIRSVDFYKSGVPARYGGKISSVVDVRTRDGSMEEFGGSFSIGLIDGRISLGGPIIRNRLSYDVAIRRSWLDAITAPILAIGNSGNGTKTRGGYALFDSNVNLTYTSGPDDRINLRFFAGTDRFNYSESEEEKYYGKEIYYAESGEGMKMKWGNIAASASWKHGFSRRSGISTVIYYSRGYSDIRDRQQSNDFTDEILTTGTSSEMLAGSANAAGLRSILTLSFRRHILSAGVEYQNTWYSPSRSVQRTEGDRTTVSDSGSKQYRANEASVFIEDGMTFGPFSLTAGIRLDGYFTDGAAYFRPQPRISASYSISDRVIAKASYESMSQYAHLLSSIYIDLPTNLWMPSTDIVRPSDSRQAAAGVYARLSRHWHVDIGGYWRSIQNCLIYSGAGSLFPPVDRWEEEFISGKGRSYGAELEVQYLSGKITGTACYTLSWNQRRFDRLHSTWFRDRFDNRHKLTLTCSYRITDDIDINATWNYHSGNRVTVPEHTVCLPGGEIKYLFSEPYNAKMPDYHRLDLGCNIHRKTRRGNESVWNISIYNAYCRMNPVFMRTTINDEGRPKATVYSLVPIIPSFSYTLKF